MPTSKTKKIDRSAAVSFFVNFCAVFALIGTVGMLLVVESFGGNRAGMASASASLQGKGACVPAVDAVARDVASGIPSVLFPVSSNDPSEAITKITVDDGGWTPNRIDLSLASARTLEITNAGVNPHSFVIDGAGIDSGAIAPGVAKTMVLNNLSDEVKDYTYYSNMDSDGKGKFSGIISVSK